MSLLKYIKVNKTNNSIFKIIIASIVLCVALFSGHTYENNNDSNEEKKVSTFVEFYKVTKVIDGDTIKVNFDGKEETIRLIGMDTPEIVDPRKPVQCFGLEASNKAKELLTGKKVSLQSDSSQNILDKYRRRLAYVYLEDGTLFNQYMIEKGYAYEYTYNVPYMYQSEFKNSQKYAQTHKLGLWSSQTCNGLINEKEIKEETILIDKSDKTIEIMHIILEIFKNFK